jgi:hypothetical protein
MLWLLCHLLACFIPPATPTDDAKLLPPGVTSADAAAGWIALFDGETLYGLKAEGAVKVEKGLIIMAGNAPASIEATMAFGDLELIIDYHYESPTCSFSVEHGDNKESYGYISAGPRENFDTFKATFKSSKTGPVKIRTSKGTVLSIKSIKLRPLGLKPIFTGKDLGGWKEIPGHKSKFSVTDKGELNIKNGDGDIQTEGQWDDFILQIDVISNGDHLNSGVFFRCVPGIFWAGYEAQIRNEWQTTVALKDGQTFTGSLTEKGDNLELKVRREAKTFAKSDVASVTHHRDKAIDYGTGGIYNRREARKVVSSDREYFTMTVTGYGNHLAVWVNGYLTAEYTDNRPVNDNARRGRKDGKGCISLQGHDPTTDLNFKNIRIAELPKAAEMPKPMGR